MSQSNDNNFSKCADLVVISYNSLELTLACIASANNTAGDIIQNIIVIDNASSDGSPEAISAAFPNAIIKVNERNMGYAVAVNQGAQISKSKYFIATNSDVVYLNGAIREMLHFLESNSRCGAAGPQQIFPNGSWQRSYGVLPGAFCGLKDLLLLSSLKRAIYTKLWKKLKLDNKVKFPGYIDGAVIAIRKIDFESVGGFDEDYFFYTEESDFCRRLAYFGKKAAFVPAARVVHLRGAGAGMRISDTSAIMLVESKVLFCKKHLSKTETYIYLICETAHTALNLILLKVAHILLYKNQTLALKIKNNANLLKAWKDCILKIK